MDYLSILVLGVLAPYLQIILATVLGMVIGIERNFAGKIAGMRTYSLVTMGSCILVIVSTMVNKNFVGIVSFDPMRLAAGIIMGIGFLGAGVIFVKNEKISGLTSAAGLWVAAGIGIAVGFKLVSLSIFITLITFLVLSVMGRIEGKYVRLLANGDGGNHLE